MSVLHPILLAAGLACVAAPVLIHILMRRRRSPVRWAAMRFVLEAYRQQRRRLRLEQMLLLAARCLLIALIALGVARPMLAGAAGRGDSGPRDLFILIDNGIASATLDDSGRTELERSRDSALQALGALDPVRGDRAALVPMAAPARPLVFPPSADLALVERRLRDLRPADSATDLPGAMAILAESGSEPPTDPRRVALFSAFREGSLGARGSVALPGGFDRLTLSPPAPESRTNVGLRGLDTLRPVLVVGGEAAGAAQARARLLRSGPGVDAPSRTVVRLSAAGEDGGFRQIGLAAVDWEPGQREAEVLIDMALAELPARRTSLTLRADLEPDFNERDNSAWAVLEVREALRVAVVGTRRFGARPPVADFTPTDWLTLALQPGGPSARAQIRAEIVEASRLDAGALAGFDAAVVADPARISNDGWQAVGEFVRRGGALLLTPAQAPGAQLWTLPAVGAIGLPATIAREPVDLAAEDGGLSVPDPSANDPLWYVRSELEELTRTVRLSRLLPVTAAQEIDAGDVLLRTTGDRAVLVVWPPTPGFGGDEADASPERRGTVAYLGTAVDLEWTDLPARPLMVPLIQELVRTGVGPGVSSVGAIAGGMVRTPAGAVELVTPDRSRALAVSGGRSREPVREAGVYIARSAEGATLGGLAVQPDANGARGGASDRQRVEGLFKTPSLAWSDAEPAAGGRASVRPARADTPGPGLTILLLALGLAVVELALARTASHAGTGPPAGAILPRLRRALSREATP